MRKPITALILLIYIFTYAILAATVGDKITGWAQMPFYIVAGIVWIFPLKPLFAWMNRGTPPVEEE